MKSVLDENFVGPFLRNEFSKIFEDLSTMAQFPEMTHICDHESFPTASKNPEMARNLLNELIRTTLS